jgi:hypothetical protein
MSCGKENTEVCITQRLEKKEETLIEKMKKSPDEKHINTWKRVMHLFSSDQERYLCSSKSFSEASMCLCVPFIWRSLILSVRVSSCFSYCEKC